MDNILGIEFGFVGNAIPNPQAQSAATLFQLLQNAAVTPPSTLPAPFVSAFSPAPTAGFEQMMMLSMFTSLQRLQHLWGGLAGGGLGLGYPGGGGGYGGGFGGGYGGPHGYGGISLPPLGGQGGTLPPLPYGGPGGQGGNAPPINTNIDYKSLSTQQRNQLSGMNEEQRAALHLWGIQMGSAGKQDGGVLLNVLNHPEQFKPAEVALARKLAAQDQAQYGGITGKSLDRAFFGLYQQITGKDISARYGNSPVNFATGEVNMANRQSGQNGLSQYENEVLQLWGHSPLFTGGRVDGAILEYAMNSNNTLEANLNKGDLQTLLNADKADGVVNGNSLENTFINTLDHIYNGGPAATQQRTMDEALAEAAKRRAGLLPPVDPRTAARPGSISVFAQIFGSNDPSQCPFLNGGGGGVAVGRGVSGGPAPSYG